MAKKKIAIVAGGDSSEHDVSLRSAAGILSFMDKERYDAEIVELHGADLATLNKLTEYDYAYITIHGITISRDFTFVQPKLLPPTLLLIKHGNPSSFSTRSSISDI